MSCCLNEAMEGEERTKIGKEFPTLGAAELKARPPVTVRVLADKGDVGPSYAETEAQC